MSRMRYWWRWNVPQFEKRALALFVASFGLVATGVLIGRAWGQL